MSDSDQKHWNDNWKRGLGSTNDFARRVLEYAGTDLWDILDLGCGTGKDTLYFAQKLHRVTAMDFSENSIDALDQEIKKRKLRTIRSIIGDISEQLPFKNKSFDAVYAHLSLHYFDTLRTISIFREIHRVLRTGGLLFVKCKSEEDPLYGQGEKIGDDTFMTDHVRHFFTQKFLEEMLQDFTIREIRRSRASYDGKESAFVEAIAEKR